MKYFMALVVRVSSVLAVITLVLTACAPQERYSLRHEAQQSDFHLGDHSFPISTGNPEAQAAFDRGLTLAYAFSHKAAEREFRRAAALDSQTPMPWWGVALVNGPHINFPLVPEKNAKVAWDALMRAKALKANGTPIEQDLIEALANRYVENQGEDRSGLDTAYAAAMKRVSMKHPDNADVATLYAESLMDLHPWDLWDEAGEARAWTPEILAQLERAMKLNPRHPGAHHLYIHSVEASNRPEKGVVSADTLMELVPGAGHLVHMPAHIYLRVGRWEEAAQANINATKADAEFRKANSQPGFYAVYMLHNHHFLSFVRMMQGQHGAALEAARSMVAGVPEDFMREFGPIADGYMAIVYEVQMRFGKWEELLAEPAPPAHLPLANALWRFSRATALNALDRRKEAQDERRQFLSAVTEVPSDATFGNNDAHTLLQLARHVLDGEIAAREKRYSAALRELYAAKRIEDTLMYDEPPDWILPVRHTLGATLLSAGKAAEAEAVYREDLKNFPKNGWSLYGLSRALALQGKEAEASEVRREFAREWADADTQIASSCLCQNEA